MPQRTTEALKKRPAADVRSMATAFQALVDPVRLSILLALVQEEELTPSDLARALGRRPANISVALRFLCMAGLVARVARGKTSPYRLDPDGLERICAMLARCNRGP